VPLLMPSPPALRPALRAPLRSLVEAAFTLLEADVEAGHEVPFAIDERPGAEGPSLYAYRPLFSAFLDARTRRIGALPAYAAALRSLRDDPGALAHARSLSGPGVDDDEALRRCVIWPLLAEVAERADGFAFQDEAFDAVWHDAERTIAASARLFEAFAPLIGVLVSNPPVELAPGLSLRRCLAEDVSSSWPEAFGLLPERFGIEPDRLCALCVTTSLERGGSDPLPDVPRLLAAAVRALRLVSGGPVAGGPLVFERVDGAGRAPRPLPADVAYVAEAAAVRLDPHVLDVARSVSSRLADDRADADPLARALLRWTAIMAAPPVADTASVWLEALAPLIGPEGSERLLALRAAALCGASAGARARIVEAFELLPRGEVDADSLPALGAEVDAVGRSVLLAAILDDRRGGDLAATLDEVLLGARPRPQLVPAGLPGLPA
jgi:hypothetical protein